MHGLAALGFIGTTTLFFLLFQRIDHAARTCLFSFYHWFQLLGLSLRMVRVGSERAVSALPLADVWSDPLVSALGLEDSDFFLFLYGSHV